MDQDVKILILDRVKYIAEHFEELELIEMVTLFVATATMFEGTKDPFYDSYLRVMQKTVLAKEQHTDPRDVLHYLEERM